VQIHDASLYLYSVTLSPPSFPFPPPPEDIDGHVSTADAAHRRELLARALVALYGNSAGVAAIMPAPGVPMVPADTIGSDPVLAVLYGDQDLYMRD
jgi:hypothetical protein